MISPSINSSPKSVNEQSKKNLLNIDINEDSTIDCDDVYDKIKYCMSPVFRCIYEESTYIKKNVNQIVKSTDEMVSSTSDSAIAFLTCSEYNNKDKSNRNADFGDTTYVMTQDDGQYALSSSYDNFRIDKNAVLSQINTTSKPKMTIILKGLKNTGKSTIISTLFCDQVSEIASYKPTLCQVILTETTDTITSSMKSISLAISELNDRINERIIRNLDVNIMHNIVSSIEKIRYMDDYPNYDPIVKGIDFCFVDTAGFGNERLDKSNHEWFSINTLWSDLIFFITDKEKCFESNIEQNLFVKTLQDVEKARSKDKQIPIVIVINKIDDLYDPDNVNITNKCKKACDSIINSLKLKEFIHVSYVIISALSAFLYQKFLLSNSFDHMNVSDISKLCELEFGKHGKQLAKNKSNYVELCDLLIERLQSKSSCYGMESLLNMRGNEILSQKKICVYLIQSLFLRFHCMRDSFNPRKCHSIKYLSNSLIFDYIESYRNLFEFFNSLTNLSSDVINLLISLKNVSTNFYLNDVFPNISSSISLTTTRDLKLFLSMIQRVYLRQNKISSMLVPTKNNTVISCNELVLSHSSYDKMKLFLKDELDEMISNIIIDIVLTKWNHVNPMMLSKTKLFKRLNYVLQFTISIIQLYEIEPIVNVVSVKLISRLINELSDNILLLPIPTYGFVIVLIETSLMQTISSVCFKHIIIDLAKVFIVKKISLHENIPGYTMGLHELLQNNVEKYMRYKFLFFPIIQTDLPDCDYHWINYYNSNEVSNNNNQTICLSYNDIMLCHPALYSERLLLSDYLNTHQNMTKTFQLTFTSSNSLRSNIKSPNVLRIEDEDLYDSE